MFTIEFIPEAIDDLRLLRKFDQKKVVAAIEGQLPDQATEETRNRKRLRPNQLAEWEQRVGCFRVFYDVDSQNAVVKVVAVGQKRGSKLFVHGKEFDL
jgi:mRNA-degrading endonuclease RelE of RelBE toxin-antitoxin system